MRKAMKPEASRGWELNSIAFKKPEVFSVARQIIAPKGAAAPRRKVQLHHAKMQWFFVTCNIKIDVRNEAVVPLPYVIRLELGRALIGQGFLGLTGMSR